MKTWDDKSKPEPQVVAPASVTPPTSPGMPSMQDWHHFTAPSCMPPTPPSSSGSSSPTVASQGIAPTTTPLKAPAALLNPTPAPEPSTILVALTLAGAFAWRRRASLPRA